jgi:hypothetical protein
MCKTFNKEFTLFITKDGKKVFEYKIERGSIQKTKDYFLNKFNKVLNFDIRTKSYNVSL